MHIDKVLSRYRAPVPDDLFLDVFPAQRLSEKGIVQQIELGCRQIICGAPVGVHLLQILFCNRHTLPPVVYFFYYFCFLLPVIFYLRFFAVF